MFIGLNIGVTGGLLVTETGITLPQLTAAPALTGQVVEAATLIISPSSGWEFDGQPATALRQEYRLLVDGVPAIGPQEAISLTVPMGTGGAEYRLQLRAEVTQAPNIWSPWYTIDSGTIIALPRLDGLSVSAEGLGDYTATLTTDVGDGILYWLVTETATTPSLAAIKAGNSLIVMAPGIQSLSGSDLALDTTYYLHALHEDGAGRDSAIVSSAAFVTGTPVLSRPDAFAASAWSVADLGTGGDARVSVTALPGDGGAAITGLEFRIGTGPWLPLGGASVGDYDLLDRFTDGSAATLRLRAVNAVGAGPQSSQKSVTTTAPFQALAPDAFELADWSLTATGTDGALGLNITTLPGDGGAAITGLEYRVESGAWMPLGGLTPGAYSLSGLDNGVAVDVRLRALNGIGAGAVGPARTATPTAPPAALAAADWSLSDTGTGGDGQLTIATLPSDNGSALTALEIQVDGGAWAPLGGVTPGAYPLSDLFIDGIASTVSLRALNANGAGPQSDLKTITTTGSPTQTLWQIDDTNGGSFTISSVPLAGAAPSVSDNGDGTFTLT